MAALVLRDALTIAEAETLMLREANQPAPSIMSIITTATPDRSPREAAYRRGKIGHIFHWRGRINRIGLSIRISRSPGELRKETAGSRSHNDSQLAQRGSRFIWSATSRACRASRQTSSRNARFPAKRPRRSPRERGRDGARRVTVDDASLMMVEFASGASDRSRPPVCVRAEEPEYVRNLRQRRRARVRSGAHERTAVPLPPDPEHAQGFRTIL